MYAIQTSNLTKYYSGGKIKALEDFTLNVEKGQIFSLLGPNGAGKSTFIKIMLGIVHPTRGDASILDRNIRDYSVHSKIGYLPENHRFPDFLTARQVLYYFGKMSGVEKTRMEERIPHLLTMVKLQEWQNVKIRKYSKGMLQRLGLAQALINDPEILFLDEPTDGIDPVGRREVRDLLKSLRDQGKTIFLNSHLLSEVELVSDQAAILKEGRMIEKGSIEDFISVKQQYQLQLQQGGEQIDAICDKLNIPLTSRNGVYTVSVKDDMQLNHLIDQLRRHQTTIQAIVPRKITLEDFFIKVLGTEQEADK